MSLISYLPGKGGVSGDLINFPLTISMNEPTPVRAGHIWCKTDQIYSKVRLAKALIEAEEDDTLILLTGNKGLSASGEQKLKLRESNAASINVVIDEYSYGATTWNIHYSSNEEFMTEVKLAAPFCMYGKKDGIVDLEEGYIWDGDKWNVISIKGYSFALSTFYNGTNGSYYNPYLKGVRIYNFIGADIEEMFTIGHYGGTGTNTGSFCAQKVIPDGTGEYLFYHNYTYKTFSQTGIPGVYKKNGNQWELYFDAYNYSFSYSGGTGTYLILQNTAQTGDSICFSEDGQSFIAFCATQEQMSTTSILVAKFINNGSTFEFDSALGTYDAGKSANCYLYATRNLDFVMCNYGYSSGDTPYRKVMLFFRNPDGSYERIIHAQANNLMVGYKTVFSPDEKFFMTTEGIEQAYIYQIDYENKTLVKKQQVSGAGIYSYDYDKCDWITVPTTEGKFCVFVGGSSQSSSQFMAVYDPDSNKVERYTVTNGLASSSVFLNRLCFSIDGKYAYKTFYSSVGVINVSVCSYAIDHIGKTISFTDITTKSLFQTADSGKVTYCKIMPLPGIKN